MTYNETRRCSTPMACSYSHHCHYRQTPLSGAVQFFFPDTTGIDCQHYQPYFKPYGNDKDSDE